MGCGLGGQGRLPDSEHDDFDNSRPEHQHAADKRYRTQSRRTAASDEEKTPNYERASNHPEESSEFDEPIAF
jgi:hypothetical protein